MFEMSDGRIRLTAAEVERFRDLFGDAKIPDTKAEFTVTLSSAVFEMRARIALAQRHPKDSDFRAELIEDLLLDSKASFVAVNFFTRRLQGNPDNPPQTHRATY